MLFRLNSDARCDGNVNAFTYLGQVSSTVQGPCEVSGSTLRFARHSSAWMDDEDSLNSSNCSQKFQGLAGFIYHKPHDSGSFAPVGFAECSFSSTTLCLHRMPGLAQPFQGFTSRSSCRSRIDHASEILPGFLCSAPNPD